MTVRDQLVPVSSTVTLAPGNTPPLASRTVPNIVPADWANASGAITSKAINSDGKKLNLIAIHLMISTDATLAVISCSVSRILPRVKSMSSAV